MQKPAPAKKSAKGSESKGKPGDTVISHPDLTFDPLTKVVGGLTFYRLGLRGMIRVLMVSGVINVMLVAVVIMLATHKEEPRYFATSDNGSIIEMKALTDPLLSASSVLQWATEAATSVYTYDFANYRSQIQKSATYFTDGGWARYMDAVANSGVLKMVESKRIVVTGVPNGAPVIDAEGEIDGRKAWKITIPMLISYQSSSGTQDKPAKIQLTVIRVPQTERAKGIAISQFIEG